MVDPQFWRGRRVFLTGHTGFKGAWIALWLAQLGAKVYGYALPPVSEHGLYKAANIASDVVDRRGDVRDLAGLQEALGSAQPDIVFHLAAQSLVRESYGDPVETYAVNVMGTVNLLEAVRTTASVRSVIVVTSDKCYRNDGRRGPFREGDELGGHDPYSSSKACAELVVDTYRKSFFRGGPCRLASVRAGNVIGGGDWARDRLLPDAVRAFSAGRTLSIRHPDAVRPWQHVLDPVRGYLMLAQALAADLDAGEAWNFGPSEADQLPVSEVVDRLARIWGHGARWKAEPGPHPHEAPVLRLDCSKARDRLGWVPKIDLTAALRLAIDWHGADRDGADLRVVSLNQLADFAGI